VQAAHHAWTYVLSHGYYDAYYLKAQKVRSLIARDFANAFQEVDAIVAPVSPFPLSGLGKSRGPRRDVPFGHLYDYGQLAGIPAWCAVRTTADGLPVGIQILTRHFDETTMFRLAMP